jgi:hypothetical protein
MLKLAIAIQYNQQKLGGGEAYDGLSMDIIEIPRA